MNNIKKVNLYIGLFFGLSLGIFLILVINFFIEKDKSVAEVNQVGSLKQVYLVKNNGTTILNVSKVALTSAGDNVEITTTPNPNENSPLPTPNTQKNYEQQSVESSSVEVPKTGGVHNGYLYLVFVLFVIIYYKAKRQKWV